MKLKKLTAILLLVSLSFGCEVEEFLDREITPANVELGKPSSIEDLDILLNGSYWMLLIGTREKRWQQPITHYMQWNTIASDAFTITDQPTTIYQNFDNGYHTYNRILNHFEDVTYSDMYAACYNVIANINEAIELIETPTLALTQEREDNEVIYEQYVGEFYTLRAYIYLMLSQVFGPKYLPNGDNERLSLILKNRNNINFEEVFTGRSTVRQVYDLMISDLNTAIENLNSTKQVGRFNKNAAHALLSRVYLDMHNWQKAKEHASEAIVGYDLEDRPIDAFNHTDLSFSKEVIFETQNSVGHNWTGERHWSYISENSPSWIGRWNWIDLQTMGRSVAGGNDYSVEGIIHRTYAISYTILKEIGWMGNSSETITNAAKNDLRFQQLYHWAPSNTDYRFETVTTTIPQSPFLWVFKSARSVNDTLLNGALGEEYYNLDHAKTGTGIYDGRAHLPIIRVSEMYLTRAIASLKMGDEASAKSDLNYVKERRWDNVNGGTFISYNGTGSALEMEIKNERAKELLGEGDRLFYLKAMHYDILVGDAERRPNAALSSISYPYNELFWDLPPSEVNANPNVGE